MKGFKNTTRTQYSMGGDVGGYAKGGTAKPAMAKASKPAAAKASKPAQAKDAKPAMGKAPVKKNEGGKIGKMPPIGESVKSGNRASKMTAAEMRDMEKRFSDKKRPSPADSAKSANRVSSQEGAEARHLGVFKNGGKVAKYAEGGPVGQPMGQKPGGMPAVQPLGGPQPMGQKPGGMPAVQPLGGPQPMGQKPGGMPAVQPLGGPQPMGQKPGGMPAVQPLGGPAQLPEYYSRAAMQMLDQQPQMGMTPQQRSFGISGGQQDQQAQQIHALNQQFQAQGRPGMLGFSPEQMMQQQQMGGQRGYPGALDGIGINIAQPPSMGVIDNRIDSGNFGRPMQPSGGQPPMNLETRQKGPYSPAMQEYFRQDAINQARRGMTPAQRQLDSQGMQIPNWMKGKADTLPASGPLGRLTPPKQQQLPTPVMPLMPPKKQVMPTPVMPPNIGARDPRFKTGGLATMPKKGKC